MNDDLQVLIADDHPIFRSGLRQTIEAIPQYTVCADVGDGDAALAAIIAARPDIAVLDIEMPGHSGIEIAREVKQRQLGCKVVILTLYDDEELFAAALAEDVMGFLLKDDAIAVLQQCLLAVAAGERYIAGRHGGKLVEQMHARQNLLQRHPALHDLTRAEVRVLKCLAGNKTSREIAAMLSCSRRTVENHRANIARKLDLRGHNRLLEFALAQRQVLSDLHSL